MKTIIAPDEVQEKNPQQLQSERKEQAIDGIVDSILFYSPGTGCLIWKERPRWMFKNQQAFIAWNKKYPGSMAGGLTKSKEKMQVAVFDTRFDFSRVCWRLYFGKWPERRITSVNGDRYDNRIKNLKLQEL
jgi:hypothetical protein